MKLFEEMLPHVNEKMPDFPSELLRAHQNTPASSAAEAATPRSAAHTAPLSPEHSPATPADNDEEVFSPEPPLGDDAAPDDQQTEELPTPLGSDAETDQPAHNLALVVAEMPRKIVSHTGRTRTKTTAGRRRLPTPSGSDTSSSARRPIRKRARRAPPSHTTISS